MNGASSRTELKGLQDSLTEYFTPSLRSRTLSVHRVMVRMTVQRMPSTTSTAKEGNRTVKPSTSSHTKPFVDARVSNAQKTKPIKSHKPASSASLHAIRAPKPLHNLQKIHINRFGAAKTTEPLGNCTSTVVPHEPSVDQNQNIPSKSAAVATGLQPTVAKPLDKPTAQVNKLATTEPLSKCKSTLVPHNPSESQNKSGPSSDAAVTKGQQPTVAKPLNTPVPKGNKLASSEPLSKYATTLVPHDSSASQGQSVPSNSAAQTEGPQPVVDVASVQHHDAEGQRPGGSGTRPQTSASKKRPNAEVVSVEHGPAIAMHDPAVNKPMGSAGKRAPPLEDATDRLAQDIRNAGSKKAKMGESEQGRLIRLFHAARDAHNPDVQIRIRCEKFVEFIVDESFIGVEPRDRQELFEGLLNLCMQGLTRADIACDDPPNKRVLKAYSTRLQAWKDIRELFPGLLDKFKAQPRVLSPLDVLTEDAFEKIRHYLRKLKESLQSMPKVLKEAVVWELLGSAGHRYEECVVEVRERVAEKVSEKVP